MSPYLTDEEFASAFANTPFHYAPEGYWDRKHEEMARHPLAGRKARVTVENSTIVNRLLTCIRADYDLAVFRLDSGGELIISGDDFYNLRWEKEEI